MISQALKTAIQNSGLSQATISKMTGGVVRPPELCRWLSGRGRLGQAKIDAVARALDVQIVSHRVERLANNRRKLAEAASRVSPERNASLVESLRERHPR